MISPVTGHHETTYLIEDRLLYFLIKINIFKTPIHSDMLYTARELRCCYAFINELVSHY